MSLTQIRIQPRLLPHHRVFPNEASITRLIGAVLFEQNDEWQTASRYMMVEAFAEIDAEETAPILSITTQAA